MLWLQLGYTEAEADVKPNWYSKVLNLKRYDIETEAEVKKRLRVETDIGELELKLQCKRELETISKRARYQSETDGRTRWWS